MQVKYIIILSLRKYKECQHVYVFFAAAAAAKSLQSCPTLCDPINGSPPGSSVPGILQARTLEWVPISFSSACMHAFFNDNVINNQPIGKPHIRFSSKITGVSVCLISLSLCL